MDLSGIKSFQRKVNAYADTKADEIAMQIAEKGVEIAKGYFTNGESVYAEKSGIGTALIIAEGNNVFFDEYGTGWAGEGAYPGELPTNTFTFESAGEIRSTQGWEYHYPNEKTKKPKDNPYYWWYNGQQQTGQAPQANMWKTSRDLREQFSQITQAIIKAERENSL